jgi:aminopeptidase N
MSTGSVICIFTIAFAASGWSVGTVGGQTPAVPHDFSDDELGIKLTLPEATWEKSDHSQGNAKVFVFSPDKSLNTRCSVLHLPKVILPAGILTREQHLKAMRKDAYRRVALDDVEFCDRKARRLTYLVKEFKTIEWEIEDGESYLIFQLAAPAKDWEQPETLGVLEGIKDSFVFTGAKKRPVHDLKLPSPEEIRAARKASIAESSLPVELRHHELQVDLFPDRHAIDVLDRVTLRAAVDGVKEFTLYISEVTVQEVSADVEMSWQMKSREGGELEDGTVQELQLTFAQALPKDQDVTVEVTAHSDDFIHEIDQQLVAEIAVLGQVRERSSYSSHVVYYPVDEHKSGSMDMTLTVPAGWTAVTGGELVASESQGKRQIFRYKTTQSRPRLLPFGFAAGEYIQRSGESAGGLQLTFYGYAGEEQLLQQRVTAGIEAANVFERLMGPLPWKNVRFAHVTPVRKETGVSLPGLVLISDAFFTDFEGVDVSDGNLANRDVLSLLVVADELSHQWNAYAVPLPNQLAEGVSTFTNALFIEQRAGKQAFDNTIRYCRNGYYMSSGLGPDVAIADPGIYKTAAYRGIAFTKTAVVLAMLRELVGDDIFFAGWREAFAGLDSGEDGFQVVESAFSKTAGQDLKWFFDQWFYRPGWVKLKISHQQEDNRVTVQCNQVQREGTFRMPVRLIAHGPQGQTKLFPVQLQDQETIVSVDCPFQIERVELDPDEIGLVQEVPQ